MPGIQTGRKAMQEHEYWFSLTYIFNVYIQTVNLDEFGIVVSQ